MYLSNKELIAISAKAQSLWERLERAADLPDKDYKVEEKAEARLRLWRTIVADGDEEIFQKRLAFDGLDVATVRGLLGSVALPHSTELPNWTSILNEILTQISNFDQAKLDTDLSREYEFLEKSRPIAFEEIFLPFIFVARDRLNSVHRSMFLTDAARAAFERSLLQQLSTISSRILEVEFSTFIACLQIEGFSYMAVKAAVRSRKQYLRFVRAMYENRLSLLLQEYCVWARMVAVKVDQWVQFTSELLTRLNKDEADIAQSFNAGHSIGRVASVELGVSDPHDQGRTVVVLTFESELRLVYKPKDMGLEEDYFRLVGWLNEQEFPLSFGVLKVLNRGLYGWVEYAEHRAIETQSEARRYFERTGMLLCLVYIFDGIDFHYENVVACGEYPIPIDLETFFHHRIRYPRDVTELTSASREILINSVLHTHFLPNLYKRRGKFSDISGMKIVREQEEFGKVLKWQHINTDAMVFDLETARPPSTKNAPRTKDGYLAPANYSKEIADGFNQIYRFFMGERDTLLRTELFFPCLFLNRARFVFRPTSSYASLQLHVTHPDFQRDGVDLSIQLDVLSRLFLTLDQQSTLWPLVREEHEALYEMDIPKFTALGISDSLTLRSGEVVRQCFLKAPGEYVRERIVGLNEADLAIQLGLIRRALEIRSSVARPDLLIREENQKADEAPRIGKIDKSEMIQHALDLADELRAKADYSRLGEPSWITLNIILGGEEYMLDATDFSLYDGCSGIALFLSALECVAPDSGFRNMAYRSIALMRRWLSRVPPYRIRRIGIGGYLGLPSIVYALIQMGELLNDQDLFTEGNYAAFLIREQDIDADTSYDILRGSAGAILGLLVSHKRNGDKRLLSRAIYCGRHLLKNRVETQSGFRVWRTLDDKPLLGFSHGAAGIAYALLRLYEVSGESEFLWAAQEGIAYEADAFVANGNNWPDLRISQNLASENGSRLLCAWCNGAAGIGLARIGGLKTFDSASVRNDISTALKITQKTALQQRDHLCCGNVGRAEMLLTAGLTLGQPGWISEAVELTSRVAYRAKVNGSFHLAIWPNIFVPSLFHGTAGVGYHLLRLAHPELLPAVLLME